MWFKTREFFFNFSTMKRRDCLRKSRLHCTVILFSNAPRFEWSTKVMFFKFHLRNPKEQIIILILKFEKFLASVSHHTRNHFRTVVWVGRLTATAKKALYRKKQNPLVREEKHEKNLNFKTHRKKIIKDFFCYSSLIETIRRTYTLSNSHRQTPSKGCFSFWVF